MCSRRGPTFTMDHHVDHLGVGMSLSRWEFAEERARVRVGAISDLGRLLLWSPKLGKFETSHFCVVSVAALKHLPPDVESGKKMSVESRTKLRLLEYNAPGEKSWQSVIFARCETGTGHLPITYRSFVI